MATVYGLTPQGFAIKPQQEIISEITLSLQAQFGENINTSAQSVFGQLIGIFSEREALLWQLCAAIYASQYPTGAQGTSVDNILALNNLKRLPATPSVANLVITGTAGTPIPKSSIAQTSDGLTQFATTAAATIAAAVNAIQSLFFSSIPTLGSWVLSIIDSNGNTETTGNAYWMTQANGTTVLGAQVNPTSGQFKIATPGGTTGFINFNCASSDIQTALQLVSGQGSVTVSGSTFTGGFVITWTGVSVALNRIATLTSNTLNQTVSVGTNLQDLIQTMTPDSGSTYPFAGVTVSGAFNTGFICSFGGTTAALPQNVFTIQSNGLFDGSVAVNINVVNTQIGAPAQALVTANCTVDGPTVATAGSLNTIGTPVSGWTGVTNPLDAILGTNTETDLQALQRRTTLLSAQANGPIQSIVEKVRQVSGVSAAVGFENLSMAGFQIINWASIPATGTWRVTLGGSPGQTTAAISATAAASAVQAAINLLVNYGDVVVTGNFSTGFQIQFGSSSGVTPQPLATVAANTTGVNTVVTQGRPGKSFEIVVDYPGLPVLNAALEQAIAQQIYDAKPAGIQSFGSPVLATTGNTSAGSPNLSSLVSVANLAVGLMIVGNGIPEGTYIQSISGSTVVMTNSASLSASGVYVTFISAPTITDAFDNPIIIPFSKPQLVTIFIAISLTVSKNLFPSNGIQQIQDDIVVIGDSLTIGEDVVLFGTDGIVGAFNGVPGILSYDLFADVVPNPTNQQNIAIGATQLAQIESFNIICTVTFE